MFVFCNPCARAEWYSFSKSARRKRCSATARGHVMHCVRESKSKFIELFYRLFMHFLLSYFLALNTCSNEVETIATYTEVKRGGQCALNFKC